MHLYQESHDLKQYSSNSKKIYTILSDSWQISNTDIQEEVFKDLSLACEYTLSLKNFNGKNKE
jgi:hypothetical protein